MATIYRRRKSTDPEGVATGNWVAEIKRKGNQRIRKSFAIKAAAERWVTDTEKKLDNDQDISLSQNKTTLLSTIEKYLIEISPFKAGANQGGLKYEIGVLNEVKSLPLAQKELTKIRKSDIETVIAKWRKAGNTSSTINRKLTTLSDVFRQAEDRWGFEGMDNPCKGKSIKLKPQEGKRSRKFEKGEYEKLMTALDACLNLYIKQVVLFAIETGLRRRELLTLKRSNTYIDERFIYVESELAKTRTERYVPLTPDALKILEKVNELSGGETELIFPITEKAFEEAWKKTIKRSGLNETRSPKGDGFWFQDLRHVALTKLSRIYPRMQDLAKISGHDKLETLLIYYEEDIHDQVSQMDQYYIEHGGE